MQGIDGFSVPRPVYSLVVSFYHCNHPNCFWGTAKGLGPTPHALCRLLRVVSASPFCCPPPLSPPAPPTLPLQSFFFVLNQDEAEDFMIQARPLKYERSERIQPNGVPLFRWLTTRTLKDQPDLEIGSHPSSAMAMRFPKNRRANALAGEKRNLWLWAVIACDDILPQLMKSEKAKLEFTKYTECRNSYSPGMDHL